MFFNYKTKEKLPVEELLILQGRFKHLFKPGNEYLIEVFQREFYRRWEELLIRCEE